MPKTCGQCGGENKIQAATCERCGKSFGGPAAGEQNAKGCLVLLGVVVLIGAIGYGLLFGDGTDLDAGAYSVCTQFVEDELVSPASAQFPSYSDVEVRNAGDTYSITSTVDAQNGFGAMLRMTWDCTVQHDEGDTYTLIDLQVTE